MEDFTHDQIKLILVSNKHKIKSLFNKNKIQHHSCVVYCALCSCGAYYIGETIINFKIRWNKHNTWKNKNSDCMKHLIYNFNHEF